MKLRGALEQCFSDFRQSRTTSQAVGAHTDHIFKIPYTKKCMQVNGRNIIHVVKVAITTFFLDINLKYFIKQRLKDKKILKKWFPYFLLKVSQQR
jgi:hypothetical protein